MKFEKYQHIERVGTDEVEGLLDGKCYVFYKIDGTNSSVYVNDDGVIECASRNKILDSENTNGGFWNYVQGNDAVRYFVNDHPNLKLFGEWLIPHSLKTYREDAWRKLYIFDVIEVNEDSARYLPYDEYGPLLDTYGIDYIPPICTIENPTVDSLLKLLDKTGNFLIEDGKGLGEGIVIKNYSYRNKYGRQIWGKIVRTEFKERNQKAFGVPNLQVEPEIEKKIVDTYITSALVEKEKSKIASELGGWQSRSIPRLLDTVYHCLVTEESYNFVKKFKFPIVDFKKLRKYCEQKTKEYGVL